MHLHFRKKKNAIMTVGRMRLHRLRRMRLRRLRRRFPRFFGQIAAEIPRFAAFVVISGWEVGEIPLMSLASPTDAGELLLPRSEDGEAQEEEEAQSHLHGRKGSEGEEIRARESLTMRVG